MAITNQKRGGQLDFVLSGILDTTGSPLAGGFVRGVEPGTTTGKPFWQDREKAATWGAFPSYQITLDAQGRALAFGDGAYDIKVWRSTQNPDVDAPIYTYTKLAFGPEVVNVRDFGASPSAAPATNRAAFQEAIDYCLRYGDATPPSTPRLYVPAGTYQIDAPLFILDTGGTLTPTAPPPAPGNAYIFMGLEIHGEHRAVAGPSFGDRGSIIEQIDPEQAVFLVQGARGVSFRRLTLLGQNNLTIPDTAALLNEATFLKTGDAAQRVWRIDASGGPSYVEETSDFNSAASGDVSPFPAADAVGDQFAIGFAQRFANVAVTIRTSGVGGTVTWKYWDGSAWQALTGVLDNTSSFTAASGTYVVRWTAPSNWQTRSINGPELLFYVVAEISSGSYSTDPVLDGGLVDAIRDNAQSPHAGIVVDPFHESVPSQNRYPAPDVNATYYTNHTVVSGLSAHVTIEDCYIELFACGVLVSPTALAQGDTISIRDTGFRQNKVAINLCQEQTKAVTLDNVNCEGSLFFLSLRSYGHVDHAGAAPVVITAAHIVQVKYVFNTELVRTPLLVHGLYAEEFLAIGFVGTSTNTTQLGGVFSGCTFHFGDPAGAQVDVHLTNFAPVDFIGCSFDHNTSAQRPVVFFNRAPLRFRSCFFRQATIGPEAPQVRSTIPIAFHDPRAVSFEQTKVGDTSLTDGFAHLDTAHTFGSLAEMSRRPLSSTSYVQEQGQIRPLGSSLHDFPIESAAIMSQPGGPGSAQYTASVNGLPLSQVGDIVYFEGTSLPVESYARLSSTPTSFAATPAIVGVIKTIVGSTVTLEAVRRSFSTGTYALRVKRFTRYRERTRGDLTMGVATIANVSPDPTTRWLVNERVRHPAIPDGAYIATTTSTSITLSKAPTATEVKALLVDADSATHNFDGPSIPASAALTTTTGDAWARKLLWEAKPITPAMANYVTRVYRGQVGHEVTINARWDGISQWVKDVVTNAFRFRVERDSVTSHRESSGGSSFLDTAWTTGPALLSPSFRADFGYDPPNSTTIAEFHRRNLVLAWAGVTYSAGAPILNATHYNVASVTDQGVGIVDLNLDVALNTVHSVVATLSLDNGIIKGRMFNASNIRVETKTTAAAAADYAFTVAVLGNV